MSKNLANFRVSSFSNPAGSGNATIADSNILTLSGTIGAYSGSSELIITCNKANDYLYYFGSYIFSIEGLINKYNYNTYASLSFDIRLYKGSPDDIDNATLIAYSSQYSVTTGTKKRSYSFSFSDHSNNSLFLVLTFRGVTDYPGDRYSLSVELEEEEHVGTADTSYDSDGNLLPLFSGNPGWYTKGGYRRTANDLIIATNSDGSISFEGWAEATSNSGPYYKLFVSSGTSNSAYLESGIVSSDLYLQPGTYELGYVSDRGDMVVDGISCGGRVEVSLYGVDTPGRFFGTNSNSSVSHRISDPGYYYVVITPRTSDFSDKYTFKPYLYRQGEKPENIPIPNGDPSEEPSNPDNPGGNENTDPGNTPTNPDNPGGNGSSEPIAEPGSTVTHLDLSDIYTGTQTYTFPEDYFSSGRIYWRVRSYDSDDAPGEWSEHASFIAYGVSKVQNLQCDGKPFATITWSANGQVSYEIKIDDLISYGPFYGTDSTFVLPEPLPDGHHKVAVQVQNNLSLESPWSEVEFDVLNVPENETNPSLGIAVGIDADLWWSPETVRENDEFLVYRDNKLLRRFNSSIRTFTDRTVLGHHEYKVVQHLPSGYYNLYSHPEVFLSVNGTKIALYDGGPWLDITLTTERYPTNTFRHNRIVEKTRIMGSKYPVVEVSDFEELSATYEVTWPFENRDIAYQFRNFLGKAVIVKSRGEQVIVGVLDGYELPVNSQTVGYSFTIEQMGFDDDESIMVSTSSAGSGNYTDLDRLMFGLMSTAELAANSTNPGTSNPKYYEQIAEAINELKRFIAVLQSEVISNG